MFKIDDLHGRYVLMASGCGQQAGPAGRVTDTDATAPAQPAASKPPRSIHRPQPPQPRRRDSS
jgi:hypothetical protein